MIIVTSVRKGTPGTTHASRTGIGFGNHNPKKSNVLFTAGLVFDSIVDQKAIYKDRKEFKEQVMIPALAKAGSKNPLGMANTLFPWLLKEGKVVEIKG